MTANSDIDVKSSSDPSSIVSYKRLDGQSTVVLSNCSSDTENDEPYLGPTLKWRRETIVSNISNNPERQSNNNDTQHNSILSVEDNTAPSFDDALRSLAPRRLPPIPADKLHRRNPYTVRQELKMLDDFVPEGDLVDIELNEMPGLQNTEQWKRIAGRAVHSSPPLSRQYYQNVVSNMAFQDGQIPQPLGSYRRPGRSESELNVRSNGSPSRRLPRRRICLGSFITVVIIAVVVAVVLAVTIVPKSDTTTTEYYDGSVYVQARFSESLLDPSSTLARSYKREFCSLIGTTLADTRTEYAVFYSTCTVIAFHNGSILAEFVLGFTQKQNVSRLSWFLNRTLANKEVFGGTIVWIALNTTALNANDTNQTNSIGDYTGEQTTVYTNATRFTMTEQNLTSELQSHQQPAHTSYTTVTYTTLEKGLSITISETITITNNNLDKLPINNKNCEVILIPTIENAKTVVVPAGGANEKVLFPPPATTTAAAATHKIPAKSSSQLNLLRPIRPITETNFAYIDASSDERTYSSGDATSTLGDLTTQDSTRTQSTTSLSDGTLTDSTSTVANNFTLPTPSSSRPQASTTTRALPSIRTTTKAGNDSSEERRSTTLRLNSNGTRRQRRWIVPKNQRRLLQYELMPTGKVYYIDRPVYNDRRGLKGEHEDNSSAVLSTILSRSSSVDTLSDKRHRHHQSHRKHLPDAPTKNPEPKLSIGGRLASSNNLTAPTLSSFKPVNHNKANRFSSFEPTNESLDQVFDVLIAADKRREEHDFWREKFEPRSASTRVTAAAAAAATANNRLPTTTTTTNTSTIPISRTKQTQLPPNSIVNNAESRSQSYSNKRSSLYDAIHRQSGCLLEDCLRRRTQIAQQKLPPPPPERNYSPNTIYSTNYPKQQLLSLPPQPAPPPATAATTTTAPPQSARITSLPNGRGGRAPQARQTSDELSSASDVWAARPTLANETQQTKKPSNTVRTPSTTNRSRINQQKVVNSKRALSAEQQKGTRPPTKSVSSTTKSKFFDLFKFTR